MNQASEPQIMGVLNLTPDSCSDGGLYPCLDSQLRRVDELFAAGAHWVDLGAESTRPFATPLGPEEEWDRLHPLLQALKSRKLRLSLDSRHPETMLKALDFGIGMINDVGGAKDLSQAQGETLARAGVYYVAMHSYADPATMQIKPKNWVGLGEDIEHFCQESGQKLRSMGFTPEQIIWDPGVGFAKDDSANLEALSWAMQRAKALPLLVGLSRKGFLGRVFQAHSLSERDMLAKGLEQMLFLAGVKMIRTHEPGRLSEILRIWRSP